MKGKDSYGSVFRYFPLICLMVIYSASLYRDITTDLGDKQVILVWKDALLLLTGAGLLGNLCALDKVGTLLTGKAHNLLDYVKESENEDAAAMNGLVACAVLATVLLVTVIVYGITGIRLFLICGTLFSVINTIALVAEMIAVYLQSKQEKDLFAEMTNPIIIPMAINLLFAVLIINQSTVTWVYRNLHSPKSINLIVSLIVILIYFPTALFCHFCNIYYFIAVSYAKKKPEKIKMTINNLLVEKQRCEDTLRKEIENIDKLSAQSGSFKKISLIIQFFRCHLKAFWHIRISAIKYLRLYAKLSIANRFSSLLSADSIKVNIIRYFEIVVVAELVVLDMCLFLFLGSDNPSSRFFELLSTVIIIPILLSSITNLKKQ